MVSRPWLGRGIRAFHVAVIIASRSHPRLSAALAGAELRRPPAVVL